MREDRCELYEIDSIKSSNTNKEKFVVNFADGSKILINTSQIADYNLFNGRKLTKAEFSELGESVSLTNSKVSALKILGNRNLSKAEIKRRLVKKGSSEEVSDATTKWLEESGLINDEKYAHTIVRHYREKGYGPARIKDELYKRGIPREQWDEVLAEELDESDIVAAAESYLDKKLRGEVDSSVLRKAENALIRRGFSYEHARIAVKRYTEKMTESL